MRETASCELIARVAGQLQRLPVARGRSRVIRHVHLHQAQMVEGVGLTGKVAEVPEQPDRLGQGGGGGRVVTGQLLQETQLVEHARPGREGPRPRVPR